MRPEVIQALQALATGGARRGVLEEQQRQAALAQLATQAGQRTMPAPPPPGTPWTAPEGQEQPGWIASAAAKAGGTGWNAVMGLADLLNRPGHLLRAAATGRPRSVAATFTTPPGQLYGEQEVSGRDVLRDLGLAGQQDTWGNFAAGMGLELVTDPLNFVTTGFGPGILTSHLTETGDVARAVAGSKRSGLRALQKAETARRSAAATGSLAKMTAARKQAEKAGKRYIQPGSALGEQLRRQGYPITEPLDAPAIDALAQTRPELAALMPTLGEQAREGQRSALYFDPPFPMNLIPGMPPRQTLVRGERTLEALSKSGRALRRLPGVRNLSDQLWARGVSGGPEISRDLIQIAQQAAAESAEEMAQHTPLFRSMFRRVAKAAGEEPTLGGMTPEQIARTDQATRQVLEREALVRLMEVDRALETGLRGTVDTARMPTELKRTPPVIQGSAGGVSLKFSRDVDRALYVSTQPGLDEAAGARVWLSEQLPGLDDELIDQVAWGVHNQVQQRMRELAPTVRELSIPALRGIEEPVTAELKTLAGELATIDRIRPKYRYRGGTSVTEQLRGVPTQAEDPAAVAARQAGRKTGQQTFAGGTLEQAEMFAGRESEIGLPLVERLRRRLGAAVERAQREQAELTGTGGPGVELPRAQLEERFVAQQVAAGVPEEQARAYAEALSDRRLQDLYGAELQRGELPDEGGMWQRGRLWQQGAEEGEVPPPWFSAFERAWEQLPDNMKVDSVIPWLKKRGVKDAELEYVGLPQLLREYKERGLDRLGKDTAERMLEGQGKFDLQPMRELAAEGTKGVGGNTLIDQTIIDAQLEKYNERVAEWWARVSKESQSMQDAVLMGQYRFNEYFTRDDLKRANAYRGDLDIITEETENELYQMLKQRYSENFSEHHRQMMRGGHDDGGDLELYLPEEGETMSLREMMGNWKFEAKYSKGRRIVLNTDRWEIPKPGGGDDFSALSYKDWATQPNPDEPMPGGYAMGEHRHVWPASIAPKGFHQPHWLPESEPISSHARWTRMETPQGRVFIVDEVQSDVHQGMSEASAQIPWRKDWETRTWRRMYREAATKGADYVAWPTGAKQAERFNLDGVNWLRYEGGTLTVGTRTQTNPVKYTVSKEKLPEYVGADRAKRLLEEGELRGDDLKAVPRGMLEAYDERAVNIARKVAREYGLGEPEEIWLDVKMKESDIAEPTVFHAVRIPEEARARLMRMEQPLWQPEARQMPAGGAPKGSFEVTPEGQEIITLFKQGDISTVIHETAHLFRRHLEADELQVLEGWAGVQEGAWTEAAEEQLARAWERYLADGAAPNSALAAIFEKLKRWMIEIYQGITGSEIDVEISPEVRRVFGGWIQQDRAADISALETTLKPYTKIKEISIKHLTTDPARFQPRLGLDEAHARSIAEAWDPEQLDPLDVWPNPEKPGEFIVLSGHHRYAAAHLAKAQRVPVRIREVSEQVAKEISIRGNAGRLEMSPLEWGRIFARHHVDGETLAQIRKRYPQFRTNSAVQEHMDLMFLDPVLQDAMHRGQLPKPHGVRIAYAARKWDLTPEIQRRVWETSQERGWSVSKLKEVLEQYGPRIEAEQGLLFDFGDFAQAYERAKKLAGPLDAEIELREKQLKLLTDAKKRLAREGSERRLSETQQAIEVAAERELRELLEFKRRLEALERGEAVEPLEQLPEWVRAQLGEDSGVIQALSGVGQPENAAELAAAGARRAEIEARQEHLSRLMGARVREGVSGPPRMADEDYTRLLREKAGLMDRLELGPQELRSARRGTLDYADARRVAREELGPEQTDLADVLAEAAVDDDAGARNAWESMRNLVGPGATRMLDEIDAVAKRIRQGGLTKNQIRAANREITELLEGSRIPQYARPESMAAARQIRKAYDAMLATEMEAGVAVRQYRGSGYTMHVWNPHERGWLRHRTEEEQAAFWSVFWEHLSDRGLLPERQWVEENLLVHPGAMQAYSQTVGWDDAQVRTILMGLSPKAQDALVQHQLLEPFTRMLVDIGRPGPATLHRKSAFYGVKVKDINDAWRAAGGGEVMLDDPALQLGHRMLSHLQTMTWVRMRNMMLQEYGQPIQGKVNLKELRGLDIDPGTGWKILPDGRLWPTDINQELMRSGQRPVAFDADVAQELSRAIQKLRSPEEVGPLGRWVDWIMRKWKESVTLWYPAFHVRNWISDSFTQWVDGVNPWEWQRFALRVLSGDKASALTTAAGEVLDFDALKSELFQSSTRLGGWWGTDMVGILQEAIEAAAGYAEKGTTRTWKDYANPWSRRNPWTRGMEKLGTATEVMIRSASYLSYRQRGMTPEQAAERVQEVLFDYSRSGSTAFESTYARRLIPFWVWEKNNLARQFELLFTQPRATGTTMRLTGMTEASRDDGGDLPPWMREAPRYGLPSTQAGLRNYVLTLGLPYEDLQRFSGEWPQRPMQKLASSLTPLIKYPLELATGKDLFLGRDISEYRNAPGGAYLVPEGLRGLLGIEQRELPSGRTKLEMNPYAAHALRNLALGRLQSTIGGMMEGPASGALRALTGVKSYTVDVEEQQQARSARQLRAVEQEAVRRGAARVFPAVYVPQDKATTPEGEAVRRTLGDLRKLVRTQRKLRAEQQEAASD